MGDLHELKRYEHIFKNGHCRGRQPSVSTAPGRGGSKPPAAAQPLNIQRTAQLRQLREAKSLPYMAWAYELPYHPLQNVYSCNRRVSLAYLQKAFRRPLFAGKEHPLTEKTRFILSFQNSCDFDRAFALG